MGCITLDVLSGMSVAQSVRGWAHSYPTKGRIFIAEVEVSGYPLCSDHLESTCACDMGSYHVCEGVECRKQCSFCEVNSKGFRHA